MRLIAASALLSLQLVAGESAIAQESDNRFPSITGQVTEAATGRPMAGVSITLEGTRFGARTDSAGHFRILRIPGGPHVLRAQLIGYSPARLNIEVPATGIVRQNIEMGRHALQLKGVQVTADPRSRARGELGTASVIEQEAIRAQTAASLAGILELLPGVPLQAPGLDDVQQISLRSVPVSAGDPGNSGSSAQNLAAFGTQVILDGVPLSNNANLQSPGRGSDVSFSSAAGGGIDLRRIPAATIERVEVIRGIPSARFGDMTQGAVIVETRAGVIAPEAALRFDARTTEVSFAAGRRIGPRHVATLTTNVARTRVAAGVRDDQSTRLAAQFAHRAMFGGPRGEAVTSDFASTARLVLDTRADFYTLTDSRLELPTVPGFESESRDVGGRLSERLRLSLGSTAHIEVTSAFEIQRQEGFVRANRIRGATPVTARLTPGRAVGRYLAGVYNARTDVEGAPRFFYTRAEAAITREARGISHEVRAGVELRREENHGTGYQFDIEFPPQTGFNGVRGFDRPRAFSSIPPLATSAIYFDDRVSTSVFGGSVLNLQGGIRFEALHEGGQLLSSARDIVLEPRLNVEFVPTRWLTLRTGVGRLAKTPSLGQLSPAPQYFDVINVNFFANQPAERLAVLTTYVFDPTNATLRHSISDKAEAGFELRLGGGGSNLGVTAFSDKIHDAVGFGREISSIVREHFALANTVPGSGRPPTILEPAESSDSVPVLINRPANNTTSRSRGVEVVAAFPEIPRLRARIAVQGAYIRSRVEADGIEFAPDFDDFQIDQRVPRSPFYESVVRTGDRLLVTTRVIHHQPALGLVITGTIQHTLRDRRENIGNFDTLSFAGYVTRGGQAVAVAPSERSRPEFADLRQARRSILSSPQVSPADWLFSFQVSKTLPLDGRLSFYAFNSFDRTGTYGSATVTPRSYQSTRFGLEVIAPLEKLTPWR